MGDTTISWTNKTWNVLRGCRRVSEGCRNCYAERQARRFAGKGAPYEGLVESKLRVISDDEQRLEPRWTGKVKFVDELLTEPLRWQKPTRVFVNAMSDLFFEDLPLETIAKIYGVMAASPQHTFQVLTKRTDQMRTFYLWVEQQARECNGGAGMTPAAFCFAQAQRGDTFFQLDGLPTRLSQAVNHALAAPWPLPNVWVGVSAENQEAADYRIPQLLATPAAVRWVSLEPLLGTITLEHLQYNREYEVNALAGTHGVLRPHAGRGAKLDWVVAGCESGPYRRECNVTWLRDLRNQCEKHGTPFFLKQAEYTVEIVDGERHHAIDWGGPGSKRKAGNVLELPYLDGKQHAAFPPRRSP